MNKAALFSWRLATPRRVVLALCAALATPWMVSKIIPPPRGSAKPVADIAFDPDLTRKPCGEGRRWIPMTGLGYKCLKSAPYPTPQGNWGGAGGASSGIDLPTQTPAGLGGSAGTGPDIGPPDTHRSIEQALLDTYTRLPVGAIAYPSRMEMKQGEPTPVVVRVARTEETSVAGVPGSEVNVDRVKVSRITVACITAKPSEFEISGTSGDPSQSSMCPSKACSCLRQTIVESAVDFEWSVTPMTSGDLKMNLRVAARLFLPGDKEEAHDVLTKQGVVHVEASSAYAALQIVRANWKDILASLGGASAIFAAFKWGYEILRSKFASPARRAGFIRRESDTRQSSRLKRLLTRARQ